MTKYFEIKGKSTVRPEGLPDGFEVEETDDGVFERRIGAFSDDDGAYVDLTKTGTGSLFVRLSDGNDSYYFCPEQIAKLRDALTEFLGDGPKAEAGPPAVVNAGDPEPPLDAAYVDRVRDVWTYEDGNWGYRSDGRGNFVPIGRWDNTCDFPWKLKTD